MIHRVCIESVIVFLVDVVYIIGGWDAQEKPTNTVRGYRVRLHELAENNVEEVQVAPMLECRSGPGATQFESGIVVCGGGNVTCGELDTCETYDKSANS